MTTVAPTGPINLALASLVESIAGSSTFRTLVGATTAAQAKERIHYFAGPPAAEDELGVDELSYLRPFAILWPLEDPGGFAFEAIAYPTTFSRSGTMVCRIERELPKEWDGRPADADMEWLNIIGGICEDMMNLSATGGYLAFRRGQMRGYERTHPDRKTGEGIAQWAELGFEYNEGS